MERPAPGDATYSIRAAERVCDILDLLQRTRDGASLSDISAAAALPKSSAFRYLSVLEQRRYVERDDEAGTFRLGLAFRPQDTRELDVLVASSLEPLTKLRDLTGETTNLGVLDGGTVVHHLVVESHEMMRLAARVGERGAVHSTALGKAILSTYPEHRVRAILAATGMERFTDRTITEVDAYLLELDAVRERGYAVDDCENQPDGRCLAVVVKAAVPCGISVSAPASRLEESAVPAVAKQLIRIARRLSASLASARLETPAAR